ncbi:hypothetical protein BTW26_02655 [Pediococcus acidilactici]|nr:hypothetical protein BTW26_02655 [Pediococcus acidilactici]
MRLILRVYRRLIYYAEIILRKTNKGTFLPNFFYDVFHTMAEKDIHRSIKGISFTNDHSKLNEEFKPVIWVMWWQSENIPKLVKNNIKRLKQYSNYPVIILNEKNISKYLRIPPVILKNVKNKKVGLALFSDYIRTALLFKYGGLWIDSTIYAAGEIPDVLEKADLFTIRGINPSVHKFVPKGRWSSYVLGAKPGKEYFGFIRDVLSFYIENNIKITDYFMIDYLLDISYKDNIGNFRNDVLKVQNNNVHAEELIKIINQPFDEGKFNELKKQTYLFKLSNKKKYVDVKNNKETFYDILINKRD